MSFPVSVVVPLSDHRKWFFDRFCMQSIRGNDPAEIIVVPGEESAAVKRNAGAAQATQPYLLFVDDDEILSAGLLERMHVALSKNPDLGFAYCDYVSIPWPRGDLTPPPFACRSQPFSHEVLRTGNYIDTTSLVRKAVFPGFDPELPRFQDWDLWLTIAEKGIKGWYIPEVLFTKFMLDPGITGSVPMEPAGSYLKRKHGIP